MFCNIFWCVQSAIHSSNNSCMILPTDVQNMVLMFVRTCILTSLCASSHQPTLWASMVLGDWPAWRVQSYPALSLSPAVEPPRRGPPTRKRRRPGSTLPAPPPGGAASDEDGRGGVGAVFRAGHVNWKLGTMRKKGGID